MSEKLFRFTKHQGVKKMSIFKDERVVEKKEEQKFNARMEALFSDLFTLTCNNAYISILKTLKGTPHRDECRKYIKRGGNAYVSTCPGAAVDVAEYLSAQGIEVLMHGNVPDVHRSLYYFVCRV